MVEGLYSSSAQKDSDWLLRRYEPNTEKKKTHNRRKSSTRSLHQKLVVRTFL